MAASPIEGGRFNQEFSGAPLGTHPDLGRLRDERDALGLLSVGQHRDRGVADVLECRAVAHWMAPQRAAVAAPSAPINIGTGRRAQARLRRPVRH